MCFLLLVFLEFNYKSLKEQRADVFGNHNVFFQFNVYSTHVDTEDIKLPVPTGTLIEQHFIAC